MRLYLPNLPVTAGFILSLLAPNPAAFAQTPSPAPDISNDDIISVTGSRLTQANLNLRQVEIEDIETSAPLSTADHLRNLAGISVIQPGGTGKAEIAFRGAEANFTVVLVDGIRVNDPTNSRGGSFDFTTIAPTEIDRIDIITGGFSGLYGSDALSGVINIITKGPGDKDASHITASTHIGGSGYRSLGGTLRLPSQLSLTAAHHDSSALSPGFEHKLSSLQAKGTNEVNGWALAATARAAQSDSTSYPDASGGSLFAASNALETVETKNYLAGGSATRNFSDTDSIVITTGITHRSDTLDTPAILGGDVQGRPSSTAKTQYTRAQLTTYGRTQISDRISGAMGADIIRETGRTVSNTDFGFFSLPGEYDLNRTTLAGFGEAQMRLWKRASLTSGLRLDSIDGTEQMSWQTELIQKTSGPTVSLRYAEAFKAPSFYALGDAVVGNPGLAAEESENLQFTLRQDWARGYLSVGVFETSFTNLIDFDFATFKLVNRGQTRIHGMDGSAMWKAPKDKFRLSGNISYANTKIDGEKRQLLGRPKWSGGVSTLWAPSASWDVKASSEWVGNRPGNSVPTGPRDLKAYSRQDITLTYRPLEQFSCRSSDLI